MPFSYSVEEDKRDKHKFIMITGFEGTLRDLQVPGEIDGMRVEAIGNHSFSARQDIETVSLPESIRTLYGFAFHNCRRLKKISLYDSIDDYYDGVCRQCDSLSDIDITVKRSWFEVIRNFLADSDRTLRFLVHVREEQGYTTSCLTFPEYVYDFAENTMARTIQFSIAGSGMFYRECVDRRSIGYREYDRLFEKARIDGGSIAENIAIGRLLYPVELEERFCSVYEDYVRESALQILKRLVREAGEDPGAMAAIRALLTYKGRALFDEKSIDEAIKLAAAEKLTEVGAILMDSQNVGGADAAGTGANSFVF
jgi:hypothetical protein